jgi:membrane-associated protein
MRSIFCTALLLINICLVTKAQTLKIKVVNQYEAAVGKLIINGQEYKTIKDGTVEIGIPTTDSIKISSTNHQDISVATNSLKEGSSVVMKKSFTWKDLITPMFYIIYGGFWLLLFIIFAETGLFAGFFLPGDSLLFVAGIYSSNLAHEFLKLIGLGGLQNEYVDLLVLIAAISFAGIVGNFVGYWFGKKVGPAMFNWRENFLFKKKYLVQAQEFYDKNGGGAIIAARFIPIVRTFAPIVAGIVKMPKAKFSFFNIAGCIAWVTSMLLIGHFLHKAFPSLKDHLELIVIGIVLITTLPVLIKLFSGKKKKSTT